ncbi:MAG: hypothetical protein ACFFBD_01965 [Candidatus Hodarchaeota archaeon]
MGDLYSLTAIKTDTRLFLCHTEGNRSAENARRLFEALKQCQTVEASPLLIASDNWKAFEEGLMEVYGILRMPKYKGMGRKPRPKLVLPPDLAYVQVRKVRDQGRILRVERRIVFGDPAEVQLRLQLNGTGTIQTSYIERLNLTVRNGLARFIRKTQNASKTVAMHVAALDFFQAWYNFIKPHHSLRESSSNSRRKWDQRTPAMAEGLTDHVWTLSELLTFRVPIRA